MIKFYEDGHRYIDTVNNRALTSVTQRLSQYVSPFFYDYWLVRKSQEIGVSAFLLHEQWEFLKTIGLFIGSATHKYIELKANYDMLVLPDIPLTVHQAIIIKQYLVNLKTQADKFLEDFKHLDFIGSEVIVGNKKYAGQIDYLTEQCIIDFKTDREIEFKGYENFTKPINHLSLCNYNKYCLQVSAYNYLLGKKFNRPNLIIHFNRYAQDYNVYEIPYLYNEIKLLYNDE